MTQKTVFGSARDLVVAPLCAALMVAGFATLAEAETAAGHKTATAVMKSKEGKELGTITLTEGDHGVLLTGVLEGLTPGINAIHIHETGKCEPDFAAAGDHFNPAGRDHGLLNPHGAHGGDLPNLHVASDGRGAIEAFAVGVSLGDGATSLLSGNGTAIIIHKGVDNHLVAPTGADAERIACGVIKPAQ